MKNSMRNIFIKVNNDEKSYHKNLLDTTDKERHEWYLTLSKGQVVHVLEQFVANEIVEENRK